MLKIDAGDLGDMVWAKMPKRLPVVFTRTQDQAIIDQLTGIKWILVLQNHRVSNSRKLILGGITLVLCYVVREN